ncbi:hypothetical protein MferCBS49748_007685 [Microsporum ferrugineum]
MPDVGTNIGIISFALSIVFALLASWRSLWFRELTLGLWRRIGRLRHLRYEGRFRPFFEDPVRPPDPKEPGLEEHEREELSHQESRSSSGQGSGIESSVQPRQRHVPLLTDEEILTGNPWTGTDSRIAE